MKLDEAQLESYFTKILGIADWKIAFKSRPVNLLHKIVIRQVTRVYFNNLQITSTPLSERKVPTESEIVSTNLRGEGGNCLHINYFMKILLDSVGYNVTTIAAKIGPVDAENHVMNVVKISEQESYAIDVACGCPTAVPVPLHALPFTTPCCGGTISEFRKIGELEFAKIQIGGGFFRKDLSHGETERTLIHFVLKPVELRHFDVGMTKVWTDEATSPFCRNLFLFRHYFAHVEVPDSIIPDEDEVDEEVEGQIELQFILVFGKHILFGSATERDVKSFETYEEMIPVILKYFPKFQKSVLLKSIEYLNTMDPIEVRL